MAANPLRADELSQLVLTLNEGLLSKRPWNEFLGGVARKLDAFAASLMLRSPTFGERGLMYNYGGIPDVEEHYNSFYFAYDPFVNLPEGRVFTLHEFVQQSARSNVDVYMKFLEQIDMVYIMGADLREHGLFDARFRVTRQKRQGNFDADAKQFCEALLPHIRTAIRLAAELERVHIDRTVYSEAMDQLTMATIILDSEGKILHTSQLADLVLSQRDGLSVRNRELQLSNRQDDTQFKKAIARTLKMVANGEPALPEIVKVKRPSGRNDFGMIIRPAKPNLPGQKGPMKSSIAVFLSVDAERNPLSADVVQKLFGLTRAEAELTWRLAFGKTLAEASLELDISENTARAHLRAIFAKTGFARQSQLVSGVLRSAAMLGR